MKKLTIREIEDLVILTIYEKKQIFGGFESVSSNLESGFKYYCTLPDGEKEDISCFAFNRCLEEIGKLPSGTNRSNITSFQIFLTCWHVRIRYLLKWIALIQAAF